MIITLAEYKAYLGITSSTQDAILQIFVNSANNFIEKYIGRNIAEDDYEEYKDGNGQRTIILDNYPVNSITTFKYNQGTIDTPDWVDVDDGSYKVVPETGKIFLNFYQRRGFQNYEIVYNAGYTTIPGDLKLAGLKLAGSYYNKKTSDGINSESVGGDSISYGSEQLSNDIIVILNNYADV